MPSLTVDDGRSARPGTASGLLQMDQQIGGAIGIAAITSIYAFATVPDRFQSDLPAAFVCGAFITGLAAIIAARSQRPLAGSRA